MAAAGFKLVILGVGTPEGGRKFAGLLNPPLPVDVLYVDPERVVYRTLGLYSGLARTFFNAATPKAIQATGLDAVKEAAKNYTMIPPPKPDDALQQGGLIVVDGAGAVSFAWRDEGTADHAPIAAVLAAVTGGTSA